MIQRLQSAFPAKDAVGEDTESPAAPAAGHGRDDDFGDEKIKFEQLGAAGYNTAEQGRRGLLKKKGFGGQGSIQRGADGLSSRFERRSLKGPGGESSPGGALSEKLAGFFPSEGGRPVGPDIHA
jgi:hypothetical protein